MYSNKKIVQILGEVLKFNKIKNIIISPGSRNVPIIINFFNKKFFNTYSIIDERCAGFFALGLSQQIKKPVILNCTSGSSVVNYYPSITEAFYQKIPIIIITSDRPKEMIDTFDGQSIYQEKIFGKHVVNSTQLTEDETKNGVWYNGRLINESINTCILTKKPIHINIPLSEPLYKTSTHIKVNTKIIKIFYTKNIIEYNQYKNEKKIWNKCKKKMILLGMNSPNKNLKKILKKINIDSSIIILSETTSQICGNNFFSNIEQLLFSMTIKSWNTNFKPKIILTIGINIISKKIKYFLKKKSPKYHWHIGDDNGCPDNYKKLTVHFTINPEFFFKKIYDKKNIVISNYKKNWEKLQKKIIKKQKFFLKKETSFSDLTVLFIVFSRIPKYSIIHLGNSMIIRYYQILKTKNSIKSYCNRGVSGIDGSVSTAIGASIAIKKNKVTLIVGDISFFYDSNALWNKYVPNNFRIILINNGGGNIFDFIYNNNKINLNDKILEFLITKHNLSAQKICEMYNWKYKIANNKILLEDILYSFWEKTNRPSLLEINTKKHNNAKILKKFLLYSSKNK